MGTVPAWHGAQHWAEPNEGKLWQRPKGLPDDFQDSSLKPMSVQTPLLWALSITGTAYVVLQCPCLLVSDCETLQGRSISIQDLAHICGKKEGSQVPGTSSAPTPTGSARGQSALVLTRLTPG